MSAASDLLVKLGLRTSPDVAAPPETAGSAPGAPDLSPLAAKARPSRRRAGPAPEISETLADARRAQILDQLYDGENWEDIACMYFDARLAITGYSGFALDKQQRVRLGVTLAPAMRLLLNIDPAYVALIVFSANFAGIVTQKESQYYAFLREEAKKAPKA